MAEALIEHLNNLRALISNDSEIFELSKRLVKDIDKLGEGYFILLHFFITPMRKLFSGSSRFCDYAIKGKASLIIQYCTETISSNVPSSHIEVSLLSRIRSRITAHLTGIKLPTLGKWKYGRQEP